MCKLTRKKITSEIRHLTILITPLGGFTPCLACLARESGFGSGFRNSKFSTEKWKFNAKVLNSILIGIQNIEKCYFSTRAWKLVKGLWKRVSSPGIFFICPPGGAEYLFTTFWHHHDIIITVNNSVKHLHDKKCVRAINPQARGSSMYVSYGATQSDWK